MFILRLRVRRDLVIVRLCFMVNYHSCYNGTLEGEYFR